MHGLVLVLSREEILKQPWLWAVNSGMERSMGQSPEGAALCVLTSTLAVAVRPRCG